MRTRDSIKWLWRASEGVRSKVVLCTLTGALQVAASLVFVWVCKQLIDDATAGIRDGISANIAMMVGCMLVQILFSALERRILNLSDVLLKNKLRHRLFTRMMESRWDGKEVFHSGDALNRVMEDVRVVSEAVTKSVPAVMSAGVQFVAAFIFLVVMKPALAWAIPGITVAMLLMSKAYIFKMRKLTKDIRNRESSMQSLMQESMQNRLMIHTLERTPYVSESLSQQQEDLRERVMDKTGYSIFTMSFIQFGFSAGYATAFLFGVFGIMNGTATFGMMTAFLQLVGQIQRPIMNLSRQVPPLVNSLTSAERIAEIERQPVEEKGDPCNLGINVGVQFKGVDYTYRDSSRKILDNLSVDFSPGSTTALVGETGAGKSTIMRLILAILSPDKGEVVMYNDNKSVKASPLTRCNIVYVPQGNTLMSGTIRENLLLGDPEASESQMEEALYLAAADFVKSLPDGLDTICGEKGSGLSEGQAQRIAIARALLRKGSLLLLDEPTSALDSQTEDTLINRLTSNLAGRTMIIVTHRESTAALCQNIIRLS